MAAKILDAGGVLRTITSAKIRDGATLRTLRSIKLMDGATLRTVATFVSPLSVTATNPTKVARVDGPATVVAYSTATPTGGLAPFTYAWTVLTGTFGISGTTSASETFTATLDVDQSSNGTAKVVVTDSVGSTAEATVTVSLSNVGEPVGGTS